MAAKLAPTTSILDIMQVAVDHSGAAFLAPRDIGRLAACSSSFRDGPASRAWELLFTSMAGLKDSVCSTVTRPGRKMTLGTEAGLLPCFARPSPRAIARCGGGWGGACKMLLRPDCSFCGGLAGTAIPLTVQRICLPCARSVPETFVCDIETAAEGFLLTADDIVESNPKLPTVLVPSYPKHVSRSVIGELKEAPSPERRVALLSDVIAVAFEKHGGADGLAVVITAKNAAVAKKHAAAVATRAAAKRLKGAPTTMTERPADEGCLSQWAATDRNAMPIGSVHRAWNGRWTYAHGVECRTPDCHVRGPHSLVKLHSALEHRVSGFARDPDSDRNMGGGPTIKDARSVMPQALAALPEFDALVASAQTTHRSYGRADLAGEDEDEEQYFWGKNCLFTFDQCKIAVDYNIYGDGNRVFAGKLEIYGQVAGAAPVLYAAFGDDDDWCSEDASERELAALLSALHLREMSSSELLAILIVASDCAPKFAEKNSDTGVCQHAAPGAIFCAGEGCTESVYGADGKSYCTEAPHIASALNRVLVSAKGKYGDVFAIRK